MRNATAPTSATVETLTAEVRVLMVGNRQITLSVAKQLDVVPLADLDVMGRVKLAADIHHVIGVAQDGSLAIAWYLPRIGLDRSGDMRLHLEAEHLPEKITVCKMRRRCNSEGTQPTQTWGIKWYYEFKGQGRAFLVSQDAVNLCSADHGTGGPECPSDLTNVRDAIHEELERQHFEQCMTVQRHQDAAASPLIVLAGLK